MCARLPICNLLWQGSELPCKAACQCGVSRMAICLCSLRNVLEAALSAYSSSELLYIPSWLSVCCSASSIRHCHFYWVTC